MKNIVMYDFGENWSRWEPIAGLAKKYHLDELISGSNGLIIKLLEAGNMSRGIKLTFKDSVCAYRITEEGFRLRLMNDLAAKYGANFYSGCTLFKVEKSFYLKWISEQSFAYDDGLPGFVQFSILAMDDFVDIISNYEPEIFFFEV